MTDQRKNLQHRGAIDLINDNILEIKKSTAETNIKLDNLSKNVSDLEIKIYGNGRPGILECYKELRTQFDDHLNLDVSIEKVKKESKDVFFKIATISFAIFSLFLAVFK